MKERGAVKLDVRIPFVLGFRPAHLAVPNVAEKPQREGEQNQRDCGNNPSGVHLEGAPCGVSAHGVAPALPVANRDRLNEGVVYEGAAVDFVGVKVVAEVEGGVVVEVACPAVGYFCQPEREFS